MAQGRKAHIGMAKETTFATPVAAVRYHRFRTEGLATDIEEVTPPNILGVFDEGPTYQGLKTHRGVIEFDGHPVILGDYFLGGIGAVTTTTLEAMVRFQHDFAVRQNQFSDDAIMQPFTYEIFRDLGNSFQFAGCNHNTLDFSWGIGSKVLGVSSEVISKTLARITATAPTFESTQAFRWNQCRINLPDPTQTFNVQDIRVNVNNGLEGKAFIDQTTEIRKIRASASRIVAVSGTVLGTDAELTEFLNGTERFLKVIFTGAVLGAGTFLLEFWMPKFRYTAYKVPIGGPDELYVNFEGKAKYDPATADTPIKVRLVNGQTSY